MSNSYASHLEAPLGLARPSLRDAALRILAAHGRDVSFDPYPARYASVAGLKVFYFKSEPGVIARRGPGNWSTPPGPTTDGMQHLIDIDAGAHVLGVGWRGNGTVLHDRFVRGPWEFELLRAAGMSAGIPQMNRVAPAGPARGSRMTWPIEEIVGTRRGRLGYPITLDVVGYWTSMPEVAPAGSSFADLVALVTKCYDASRAADGEADSSVGITGFGFKAWIGKRPFKAGAPTGKPDLRYWIAPHGGARAAAALLLLLSHAARTTHRHLFEHSLTQKEHDVHLLSRATQRLPNASWI
ncbi:MULTISPECIES: hypothetical protein [unclassified Methylobacterium]|uniref:hypothetical protein n=1 Tax=unclassified Methylobacterium TaxID=2615210 RepID=UPI00089F7A47|nr:MULTISPECIES: hypothetical protein [unclassified Methylobacterium]SEG71971.1 hypothetical protein SAMN04488144_1555 [Methylobacterium sp. 190mf]